MAARRAKRIRRRTEAMQPRMRAFNDPAICQGRCRVRYGAWRSSARYRDCATRFVRDRSSLRQIAIGLIPLLGIGWFIPRLHAFPADNTPVVTRAAALLSLCSYCRR
jgi:hypothetical protein